MNVANAFQPHTMPPNALPILMKDKVEYFIEKLSENAFTP
jgi:hypothetical protein